MRRSLDVPSRWGFFTVFAVLALMFCVLSFSACRGLFGATDAGAAQRRALPGSPGKVTVVWRTESEQNCYGYYVYRARSANGPFEKVNKSVIPGAGTTHVPRPYTLVDQPLPVGEIFYYRIEQVDLDGSTRIVTPVPASCSVTQPADRQFLGEPETAKHKPEPGKK